MQTRHAKTIKTTDVSSGKIFCMLVFSKSRRNSTVTASTSPLKTTGIIAAETIPYVTQELELPFLGAVGASVWGVGLARCRLHTHANDADTGMREGVCSSKWQKPLAHNCKDFTRSHCILYTWTCIFPINSNEKSPCVLYTNVYRRRHFMVHHWLIPISEKNIDQPSMTSRIRGRTVERLLLTSSLTAWCWPLSGCCHEAQYKANYLKHMMVW